MYSRFLFVGLGGSGGKTLRFLKRDLQRWQSRQGIEDPLPVGWQFVNIDTPTVADGTEINDRVDPLPPDEYVGLVGKAIGFPVVSKALDARPDLNETMATWRVNPVGVGVPLSVGAGQERAIGQSVAMAYASNIHQTLRARASRLHGADVLPQLGKLYSEVNDGAPAGENSNVYVVVVSSLAGGSGAGLLNLVCDMLRADGTLGDDIFAVLYMPDVFADLGGSVAGGVQPNALAATSELMNGMWRKKSPESAPSPVLSGAGSAKTIAGSGPSFPFLVGLKNAAGVHFGTHDTAFEMTARSLVSWVTASASQSSFVSYTIANWEVAAKANVLGPVLVDEGGEGAGFPQFSALGFARVSVGADHFENYAALRLARDANEHLVDYHVASEEARQITKTDDERDPNVLSRRIAEDHRDTFLRSAGLSEYGPEENQISDKLQPPETLVEKFKERSRFLASIGSDAKKPVSDWTDDIRSAVTQAQREYSKDCETAIREQAERWAEELQDRVLDAVEDQITARGLHVAKSLCEIAATHLNDDVESDLRHDAAKYREWHSRWEHDFPECLAGLTGSVAADEPALDEAVLEAVHYAKYVGQELARERAAELCPEISKRLLMPLAAAISDAHAAAAADKGEVMLWPPWGDGAPPKMVTPPAGEFALIEADAYPAHFRDLLAETFAEVPEREQRDKVRCDVIDGRFLKSQPGVTLSEYRRARCLAVSQNWWPGARWMTMTPLRPSANLRVEAKAGVGDLRRRARRWMGRDGTPFANLGNLTLRSYLGSEELFAEHVPQKHQKDRLAQFINQLNGAIKASAPLVDIDNALLGLVHPSGVGVSHQRFFSEIPLQGHDVEKQVSEVLVASGVDDKKVPGIMGNDASLKHIDITSILHAPHSLLAMKSLIQPIADAWGKASSLAGSRYAFWRHRRGQPLDKFVPVPQSMLLCMIRGWFTGILLGHIDPGDGSGPASIMSPSSGSVVEFPHPFLTERSQPSERLGQVLESLALANMSVGVKGDLAPLAPYKALRDLGKADADLSSYKQPAPMLQRWIDSGDLGAAITGAHRFLQEIEAALESAPAPGRRAEALADLFSKSRRGYEQQHREEQESWSRDPAKITEAPLWVGLWNPMSRALEQLSEACTSAARRLDDSDDLL